jgi:hypothetical protein
VVVRPPNSHEISSYAGVELVVSNAVQGVITELRERLSAETVAPIRLHRSRDQLINDLREIAPIGWRLNAAFSANADEVAYELRDTGPREPVVHVCRANESDLTLPW